MHEFLAVTATFCVGLVITGAVTFSLENRQLANNPVDENADVRPGIVSVSANGFAGKLPPEQPVQLGLRPDSSPNEL